MSEIGQLDLASEMKITILGLTFCILPPGEGVALQQYKYRCHAPLLFSAIMSFATATLVAILLALCRLQATQAQGE